MHVFIAVRTAAHLVHVVHLLLGTMGHFDRANSVHNFSVVLCGVEQKAVRPTTQSTRLPLLRIVDFPCLSSIFTLISSCSPRSELAGGPGQPARISDSVLVKAQTEKHLVASSDLQRRGQVVDTGRQHDVKAIGQLGVDAVGRAHISAGNVNRFKAHGACFKFKDVALALELHNRHPERIQTLIVDHDEWAPPRTRSSRPSSHRDGCRACGLHRSGLPGRRGDPHDRHQGNGETWNLKILVAIALLETLSPSRDRSVIYRDA